MKKIPNIVTALRIVLSAVMLLTAPLSMWFFMLYFLCGATDVLDGLLARKLGAETALGARLDSVADIVFFAAALVKLLPTVSPALWVMVTVALIASARITSIVLGAIKWGRPRFLHTYMNKAAGAATFSLPFLFITTGETAAFAIACTIAATATAEELLIICTTECPDADMRFFGDTRTENGQRRP